MREITLRIGFGNEVWEFILEVPKEISNLEVTQIIKRVRESQEIKAEYDKYGHDPDTLLKYVCGKYNWKCRDLDFDIEL